MLSVERRPPTEAELAVAFPKSSIRRRTVRRADAVLWCMMPMMMLGGGGWVIQDIVHRMGTDVSPWPVVVGALLGAPVTAFVGSRWMRHAREQRNRSVDEVEVLRVTGARFVEMEQHNDEGPHYFFEVDASKLLFLSGQCLFDPFVQSAADREFPTADFDLVRELANGRVLTLSPRGDGIAALRTVPMSDLPLGPEFPFAPSVLSDGTLADLPAAITAASRPGTRRTRKSPDPNPKRGSR
jgi:hypothetical protein